MHGETAKWNALFPAAILSLISSSIELSVFTIVCRYLSLITHTTSNLLVPVAIISSKYNSGYNSNISTFYA
jgi:hypothetical protein